MPHRLFASFRLVDETEIGIDLLEDFFDLFVDQSVEIAIVPDMSTHAAIGAERSRHGHQHAGSDPAFELALKSDCSRVGEEKDLKFPHAALLFCCQGGDFSL